MRSYVVVARFSSFFFHPMLGVNEIMELGTELDLPRVTPDHGFVPSSSIRLDRRERNEG